MRRFYQSLRKTEWLGFIDFEKFKERNQDGKKTS
jgi:hypothetical protein